MLFFLVRLYARLPLAVVRALGRALGWVIYLADRRYRHRLLLNLSIAKQTGAAIKTAAIAGVGQALAEAPWVWGYSPAQLKPWIHCEQKDLLVELAQAKQPVLFLTPHLGSFEMTAKFLAAYLPITVLYKEPHAKTLRAFMANIRNADNLLAVPANLGGVKTMLKALRAGEAVGILPDQVPKSGEGRWANFFGEPAFTMTLPEKLAKAGQARVVIVIGTPLTERARPALKWQFELEEMHEAPTAEHINQRLEAIILRHPELYLWGYNRYKRPNGVAPPNPEPAELGLTKSSHDA
jgi:Kdo2-lipid IVA lauroyltransferase/acyltransferase